MQSNSYDWNRCLEYAALSDIGMRRRNNQDAMQVALAGDVETWYRRGHVFLVADGMGAHAAGELASRLTVDTIPHLYNKYAEKSPPEALQKAIQETNAEVHRRGEANAEFHNMGTTCETLVLLPQGALLAHVGDSRIYRLRGDKLHQLTFDHSLVWEMRAAGQISDDSDVASAIPKNVITRSLGPNPKVKVDIEGPYPTAVGDTFLICSDGLTGRVEDEELGPIMAYLSPKEACQILIDLANLRGGPDNITVVIAKVTGPEMTTRVARAEPLTVGSHLDVPTTVHPALWVVTGVCFLAGIVMAALDQLIPALMAGIGGAIALAIGLIQKFGTFASGGVALSGQRRLGRGPYVEVTCAANQEMADNLASLTSELREAAEGQVPTDGIAALDRHAAEAAAAGERGDYPAAVRQYCQVISQIMRLLREERDTGTPSDSTVDL